MRIANTINTPLPMEPVETISSVKPPSPGTPRETNDSDSSPEAQVSVGSSLSKLPTRPIDDPMSKAFLLQNFGLAGNGSTGSAPSIRMEDRFGDSPETGGGDDGGSDGDSSGASSASSSASGSSDGTDGSSDVTGSSDSNPTGTTHNTDGDERDNTNTEGTSSKQDTNATEITFTDDEAEPIEVSAANPKDTSDATDTKTSSTQDTDVTEIQFSDDEAEQIIGDPQAFDPLTNLAETSQLPSDGPQLQPTDSVQMQQDAQYTTEAEKEAEMMERWLDNNDDLRHHIEKPDLEPGPVELDTTYQPIP